MQATTQSWINTPPSDTLDSSEGFDRSASRGRTSTRKKRRHSHRGQGTTKQGSQAGCRQKRRKMDAPTLARPSYPTRYASPSRSPSRSASPAKQLRNLETAKPSVKFLDRSLVPSGTLRELRTRLARAVGSRFLPVQLRQSFEDNQLLDFDEVDRLFGDDICGQMSGDDLEHRIGLIMKAAQRCAERSRDEAAWSQVARSILQLALDLEYQGTSPECAFEILDIRNQMPATQFLPSLAGAAGPYIPAKKSDLALGFELEQTRIAALQALARLPGSHEIVPLSHSADFDTSSIPLQCAVEVKKEDGGHLEARTQLATWHAAAILHARYLLDSAERDAANLLPEAIQVGWLAIGHRWELYFTGQTDNEHISCYGPILSAELGTTDRVSLLRLIAAQRIIMKWLTTEYWTTFEQIFRSGVTSRTM
ncbi:hypothetical protein KVT40_001883 [Elsinoe batatas]|uniref:PD-(D/E)XK nuclease-like domain-containing protein n=1 Tax=Elsinoe batatas TaxID=2601811 RepID=A0A8K0L860_9PEZI|nr:hypothetical protein KVT40_001883 [Elsinoe batatas]